MSKELIANLEKLAETCIGKDQESVEVVNLSAQRIIVQSDPNIRQAAALTLYRRYEGFRNVYMKRADGLD